MLILVIYLYYDLLVINSDFIIINFDFITLKLFYRYYCINGQFTGLLNSYFIASSICNFIIYIIEVNQYESVQQFCAITFN